jgi:alpha-1,6-mannosyltransferase
MSSTAASATALPLARSAVLGFLATVSITVGALLGGRAYENHLPGAWFFGMPGGLFGSMGSFRVFPPVYAMIPIYGGLLLLVRVWIGLLRQLIARRGFPVKRVVVVVVIWAIPLLLAPPLFSRDVYSYAGQGEMVSHHINPYAYGTGVLGSTPFSSLPDTVWTNTPSPYGPSFLGVDGLLNDVSGHNILGDLVLLRLLEVASLALIVCAVPTLARALGRDPAETMLLGAGSPLVLLTVIGGAHNDGFMIALLVAGLAVAQRFGTVPGLVLCALAAGVKSPAALGVVFLGWVWAGPGASLWRRLTHTAGAALIALGTMEAVAVVTGIGWGWLHSSSAADKSFTLVTPIDAVSRAASDVVNLVGLHVSAFSARTVIGVIGLALAAGVGVWLLSRSPREGVTRTLGLTLLVVALLGPILWAWYVVWGVVVLAPAASPRLRTALIVISTFEVFVGVTTLHSVLHSLLQGGLLATLVLVGLSLATAIVPLAQFGRSARPLPDPAHRDDRVLLSAGH